MEFIYNLLPNDPNVVTKEPRHTSKFRDSVREEEMKNKFKCKTLGQPKNCEPGPQRYLRAHKAEKSESNATHHSERHFCSKKPNLPVYEKEPVEYSGASIDFIQLNKKISQSSFPKVACPVYVDKPSGDRFPLRNSGLMKQYIYKKDFGVVPEYLIASQENKIKTAKLYKIYNEEKDIERQMPMLSPEQREDLINSLKARHQKVYGDYQRLSVIIDTLYKRQKKEYLEKQLTELEADIKTIEDHKFIFIEK